MYRFISITENLCNVLNFIKNNGRCIYEVFEITINHYAVGINGQRSSGAAEKKSEPGMNTYFSVEYMYLNPQVDGGDDYDNTAIMAKVGKVVAPNIAVEGFVALGVASEKWTSESGCDTEEVSTDSIIGAQARAFADLTPSVSIHGVLGINVVDASRTIGGTEACYGYEWSESSSDSETAITYGFGGEFKINKVSSIIANYQVFYDDEYEGLDLFIPGFSVGYKHGF